MPKKFLPFGIVFATIITLLLIPCLYVILEDLKGKKVKSRLPSGNRTLAESPS